MHDDSSATAAAVPFDSEQASAPAALAAAIVEWDRRGRLVDDESFVQNNAPAVSRSYYDLLEALREISLGRGPFKVDPMAHAESVIEAMKEVARDALVKARTPAKS